MVQQQIGDETRCSKNPSDKENRKKDPSFYLKATSSPALTSVFVPFLFLPGTPPSLKLIKLGTKREQWSVADNKTRPSLLAAEARARVALFMSLSCHISSPYSMPQRMIMKRCRLNAGVAADPNSLGTESEAGTQEGAGNCQGRGNSAVSSRQFI